MKKIMIFLDESGTFIESQDQRKSLIAGLVMDGELNKSGNTLSLSRINSLLREIMAKQNIRGWEKFHATECDKSTVVDVVQMIADLQDFKVCCIEYSEGITDENTQHSRYVRMFYQLVTSLIFYTDLVDETTEEIFLHIAERCNFEINKRDIDGMLMAANEEVVRSFPKLKIHRQVHSFQNTQEHQATQENRLRLADFVCNFLFNKSKYRDHKILDAEYHFKYSDKHIIFRKLCDQFILNSPSDAIIGYFEKEQAFSGKSYYRKRLEQLLDQAFADIITNPYRETEIAKLCHYAQELSKTSDGEKDVKNIKVALQILSSIEKVLLPALDNNLPFRHLYFRVCHNFVRCANHTSNYPIYQKYVKEGMKLSQELKNHIHYYNDIIDFENAAINGIANYYKFTEAIILFESLIKKHEAFINAIFGVESLSEKDAAISKPLGKLMGSLGQNYAFAGDKLKRKDDEKYIEYFSHAESYFVKAIKHFTTERDIAVQYSNLFHLAISQEEFTKAEEYLQKLYGSKIISYGDAAQEIITKPSIDMYLLLAVVKMCARVGDEEQQISLIKALYPKIASLQNPFNDHPTPIMLNYIAEMQIKRNFKADKVKQVLETSLKIIDDPEKPALYVMAAKSYILLAQSYFVQKNEDKAKETLLKASQVWEKIQEKNIDEILFQKDGKIYGYFAEDYENLCSAIKNNELEENTFTNVIPKYPFNYG